MSFMESAERLKNAKEHFKELTPFAFAKAREESLFQALVDLAAENGVQLQMPTRIDAKGEISVVALNENGGDPQVDGCGQFGEVFSQLLNQCRPRTGEAPNVAIMIPVNGWCYVKHFELEKMIVNRYDQICANQEHSEKQYARDKF